MWAAFVLCCGGLTTLCGLVGVASPQFGWLPSSSQCVDCWPLVGGAGSWGGWLQSLMGFPGLVQAHWWVEPGYRARVPRSSVSLLVGEASS